MADVASNLYQWSTTASINSPSGSTNVGTGLDDNLREIQAVIRAGLASKGADIASATTTDLGAVAGLMHDITGTTTITGFGTVSAGIWKFIKFEGALTLTHNSTSLILPGGANITTADGDCAIVISEGSGNWRCLSYMRASGLNALPPGHIYGCTLSNNGSDATNDIDFAAGSVRDSTNTANITVAAMTKRLDANWAAGTNQGMRYSGAAIANTTYGVWAVSKADGTQDIYAYPNSGAPSAATVLAALQAETGGSGYLYVRRIGSIIRSGGTILAFKQDGDYFALLVPVLDVDVTSSSTSASSATITVPLGNNMLAFGMGGWGNSAGRNNGGLFSDLDTTDAAPSSTTTPGALTNFQTTNVTTMTQVPWQVRTNTSGQIRRRSDGNADANTRIIWITQGWFDRRGRDA